MTHLGRGLDALIQEAPEAVDHYTGITTLKPDVIIPNKYQPRKVFDPEKLTDLVNSLKENGMIQPIIVTSKDQKEYELIAGERRLEAAKLAGFSEVPVIIRSVSEREQLQYAIIENIQRENLTAIEEAEAYRQLKDEFGMTHDKISEIMGKDRATISNALRLLKLEPAIREMILAKTLSAGHARAILAVDEEARLDFAQRIIKEGLSVRQAEKIAKTFKNNQNSGKNNALPKYDFSETESRLKNKFDFKVKISQNNNDKGKVTFFFNNNEERERLLKLLSENR
ncbi:MAG: chromosome partitioning protein ParB [Candidatus Cloacimonadota bacterium]|nr:MAG: chromosome partitioning protein ParB [Candidatus Cloacimonadota bacterium]